MSKKGSQLKLEMIILGGHQYSKSGKRCHLIIAAKFNRKIKINDVVDIVVKNNKGKIVGKKVTKIQQKRQTDRHYIHFILKNLKCNTKYTYQIQGADGQTFEFKKDIKGKVRAHEGVSFTTPPRRDTRKTTKFVTAGDHEAIYDGKIPSKIITVLDQRKTTRRIYKKLKQKNADFFVHLGDVYHGEGAFTEKQITKIERFRHHIEKDFGIVVRDRLDNVYSYRMLDDHDLGANGVDRKKYKSNRNPFDNALKVFNQMWPVPEAADSSHKEDGLYYKVEQGNLELYFLHNRLYSANKPGYSLLGKKQYEWLRNNLTKRPSSKNIIRLIFTPLPFVMGKNPEEDYRKDHIEWDKLLTLFANNHVRAIFAADSHFYSRVDIKILRDDGKRVIIPHYIVGTFGGYAQKIQKHEREKINPKSPTDITFPEKLTSEKKGAYQGSKVRSYYSPGAKLHPTPIGKRKAYRKRGKQKKLSWQREHDRKFGFLEVTIIPKEGENYFLQTRFLVTRPGWKRFKVWESKDYTLKPSDKGTSSHKRKQRNKIDTAASPSNGTNTQQRKAQPTRGWGNCAFHATLGLWNGHSFECSNITEARNRVAQAIKTCKPSDPLFRFVKTAIMSLIMEGQVTRGAAIQNVRELYKKREKLSDKRLASAWKTLNSQLLLHEEIVKYIEQFMEGRIQKYEEKNLANLAKKVHKTKLAKMRRDSRTRFNSCLNEDDGTLKRLIFSIPTLFVVYEKYTHINESVEWDKWINKTLIKDYATFIKGNGNWLLPCELAIIAHEFGISIELHQRNMHSVIYHPGAEQHVHVFFNGRNHYERMTTAQMPREQDHLSILSKRHKGVLNMYKRKPFEFRKPVGKQVLGGALAYSLHASTSSQHIAKIKALFRLMEAGDESALKEFLQSYKRTGIDKIQKMKLAALKKESFEEIFTSLRGIADLCKRRQLALQAINKALEFYTEVKLKRFIEKLFRYVNPSTETYDRYPETIKSDINNIVKSLITKNYYSTVALFLMYGFDLRKIKKVLEIKKDKTLGYFDAAQRGKKNKKAREKAFMEVTTTDYLKSCILIACANGKPNTALFLLGRAKSEGLLLTKVETPLNRNILHLMALHGHDSALQKLFQTKLNSMRKGLKKLLDKPDDLTLTPLHHAAIEGQKEVVEILINEGASVEAEDKHGRSPLHYACSNGYLVCAEILFKKEPELLAKGCRKGKTPFYKCVSNGYTTMAEYFLTQTEVERSVFIDKPDIQGYTPLHNAAYWGFNELLCLLLKHGADVNAVCSKDPIDKETIYSTKSPKSKGKRKRKGKGKSKEEGKRKPLLRSVPPRCEGRNAAEIAYVYGNYEGVEIIKKYIMEQLKTEFKFREEVTNPRDQEWNSEWDRVELRRAIEGKALLYNEQLEKSRGVDNVDTLVRKGDKFIGLDETAIDALLKDIQTTAKNNAFGIGGNFDLDNALVTLSEKIKFAKSIGVIGDEIFSDHLYHKSLFQELASIKRNKNLKGFYLETKVALASVFLACIALSSKLIAASQDNIQKGINLFEKAVIAALGSAPMGAGVAQKLAGIGFWGIKKYYEHRKGKRQGRIVSFINDAASVDTISSMAALELTKLLEWQLLNKINAKGNPEALGKCFAGIMIAAIMDEKITSEAPEDIAYELTAFPFVGRFSLSMRFSACINEIYTHGFLKSGNKAINIIKGNRHKKVSTLSIGDIINNVGFRFNNAFYVRYEHYEKLRRRRKIHDPAIGYIEPSCSALYFRLVDSFHLRPINQPGLEHQNYQRTIKRAVRTELTLFSAMTKQIDSQRLLIQEVMSSLRTLSERLDEQETTITQLQSVNKRQATELEKFKSNHLYATHQSQAQVSKFWGQIGFFLTMSTVQDKLQAGDVDVKTLTTLFNHHYLDRRCRSSLEKRTTRGWEVDIAGHRLAQRFFKRPSQYILKETNPQSSEPTEEASESPRHE